MRSHEFVVEAYHGLKIKPDDPRYKYYVDAISSYTNDSWSISDRLHRLFRGKIPASSIDKFQKEVIQVLDDMMWNHPLESRIKVYHGCKESPLRVWEMSGAPMDKPLRVHLPAFTSATFAPDTAKRFSRFDSLSTTKYEYDSSSYHGFNILKIIVPAGVGAVDIQSLSKFPDEEEVLLDRGLYLIIDPYPEKRYGALIWTCRVVDYTPREEFLKEENDDVLSAVLDDRGITPLSDVDDEKSTDEDVESIPDDVGANIMMISDRIRTRK